MKILKIIFVALLTCTILVSTNCVSAPSKSIAEVALSPQEDQIWVHQMNGLCHYLSEKIAELIRADHNELHKTAIANLIKAAAELGKQVAEYENSLSKTSEMRKELSREYCSLIQQVAALKEKISPPTASVLKET